MMVSTKPIIPHILAGLSYGAMFLGIMIPTIAIASGISPGMQK